MNISVIIITRNEERNITECLQSVSWSNDIVLVDSESSDRTVEIAKKMTAKIYVRQWEGYAQSKNFALQHVVNDWVLWIDADERVPHELAEEIQRIVQEHQSPTAAYEVARRAYFIGKWIRHCGWYPGYVVRLFKKSQASFAESRVHEHLDVKGSVGRLQNDLLHYTDENLYHYFSKFNRYTTLAAEDLIQRGKKYSLYDILVRPPFLFFKMYIVKRGFLDGMHGLILSLASSSYVFCKYVKLWDINRVNGSVIRN